MNKRTITILLTLSMLLSTLSACSSTTNTGEPSQVETTSAGENNVAETTSAETRPHDDLPSDLTLHGEKVTFLYREEVSNEFFAEDLTGELVDDAIYNSHLAVEERLDTDIETILEPGHYGESRNTYMNTVTNTIMANDDVYDWVDLLIANAPVMAGKGLFMNLLNTPYIDLDKPWYLADMKDEIMIDNRLYFITGNASLGYLKSIFCIYFNAQLADEFQVGNLYSLVKEGKWTLDKVMEIAEIASVDMDNDGNYGMEDKLGFALHDGNHLWGFAASCETPFYERDENGVWQFTFGDERDVNVCDKLYQFSNESMGIRMTKMGDTGAEGEYADQTKKFMAGEILLLTSEMDDVNSKFRAIEYPYGVLPYPKYSEDQTAYYSVSRATHNVFTMPLTCGNPEAAGAVMEALSCQNYNTILPAYFETSMKAKYSLNEESSQMFDIIRDSTRLTFWYTYHAAVGDPLHNIFQPVILDASGAGALASTVAGKKKMLDTGLEKFLEEISTLAE